MYIVSDLYRDCYSNVILLVHCLPFVAACCTGNCAVNQRHHCENNVEWMF